MPTPESAPTPPWWSPRRLARARWGAGARGRPMWRRGRVLAAVALLVALVSAFPGTVPNAVGRPGSLVETFLPWLGLAVPVLLFAGILRRSPTAVVAVAVPLATWFTVFGGMLGPGDEGHDLVVVQHNVADDNPDPAGTAKALAAAGPELIALEELTEAALLSYASALAAGHPHHAVVGTVGLWSRFPLSDVRAVDIKPPAIPPGWSRGLRATVETPGHGPVAVYVAHLPSLRLGTDGFGSALRDESAALLGAAIAAEPLERLVLIGDLNSTVDDRGLRPVTRHMTPQGPGFAFSWPAAFPVARVDQVLARNATVTRIRALPATGSDHLPVAADVRF